MVFTSICALNVEKGIKFDMKKNILLVLICIGIISFFSGVFLLINENKNLFLKENRKNSLGDHLSSSEYNQFYLDVQQTATYFDLYSASDLTDFNVANLNNQEKTKFILDIICPFQEPEVTEEQVIAEATKYFASFDLYKDTITTNSNQTLFQYQDAKYTYVSSVEPEYTIATSIVSNDAYKDYWILKKKIYFIKSTYKNNVYKNKVYKSVSDYEKDKSIYSFESDMPSSTVDDYDKIEDKLNVYTYTFKRSNDHYILDTIKMED